MEGLRPAVGIGLISLALAACGGGDDDEGEVPNSAQPVTAAFSQTGVIAVGFGAPLGEAGADLGAGSGQDEVRNRIEQAFGGNLPDGADALTDGPLGGDDPIVTGNACATWAWGVGLAGTLTFDMCTFQTGDYVDGGLGIAISLTPVTIELAFDALTINTDMLDGSLGITNSGTDLDRVTTLTTDFTYTTGGGETSMAFDDVEVTNTPLATEVSGSGALTTMSATATVETTFTATGVHWTDGECHPSDGTLAYDDGTVAATIGFLDTTPVDGIVTVSVGNFTTETMLLQPCP